MHALSFQFPFPFTTLVSLEPKNCHVSPVHSLRMNGLLKLRSQQYINYYHLNLGQKHMKLMKTTLFCLTKLSQIRITLLLPSHRWNLSSLLLLQVWVNLIALCSLILRTESFSCPSGKKKAWSQVLTPWFWVTIYSQCVVGNMFINIALGHSYIYHILIIDNLKMLYKSRIKHFSLFEYFNLSTSNIIL